jgi:hypothetical protein
MVSLSETQITQNVDENHLDNSYIFDFDDKNFKIAVGFTPTRTFTSAIDPEYFEVIFINKSHKDGVTKYVPIPSHVCTKEDI